MKKWSVRLLSALCVAALLVGLLPLAAVAAETHTIWIVGDSTVCDYEMEARYVPRNGYGQALKAMVNGELYTVENLAISGTSSKDYPTHTSGYYNKLTAEIGAGDILIIGFGHNDEKYDTATNRATRYTDPTIDGWETNTKSFGYYLYNNYIKVATDAGATPILCTPIVRRTAGDSFSASQLHVTAGTTAPAGDADAGTVYPGGDYVATIKKVGEDKGVSVIDMTTLTKEEYLAQGKDKTQYLHSWESSKAVDNTHLNAHGAKLVAWLFANAVKNSQDAKLADLAAALTPGDKPAAIASAEDTLFTAIINAAVPALPDGYTSKPNGEGKGDANKFKDFTLTSGDETQTFYGTMFGLLGATGMEYYTATATGNSLQLAVTQNKGGKISAGGDGMFMYYFPVPANATSYSLTAKATVNVLTSDNQSAFGLMIRDDMYINEKLNELKTTYVAAGTRGDWATNCLARDGQGAFSTDSDLTGKGYKVGDTIPLSVSFGGDNYVAQFGDEPAKKYDTGYSMRTLDTDYVYVGMFVARTADVTFSDIVLTVTLPDEGDDGNGGGTTDPGDTVITDAVAGGGLETLFAELPDVADADVTAVKWSGDATGELTGDDLAYLVREATLSGGKTGVRIDIPGVKAGTYTLQVTAKDVVYTAKDLTVQAHDRSGFAHQTVADDSTCTPYTEGVGAYKDDGTLKDNAIVLYVTDENKDTVTMNVGTDSVTGIGKILNSGQATNNGVSKVLLAASRADAPVVVRIVGTVNQPQGVSPRRASTDAAQQNGDNGGMCYMSYAKNLTIEGIGPDATIKGWGLSFRGDATDANNDNYGKNFEVRNLSFREVPEDCVEITGNGNSNGTIKEPVSHAWVHNCAFYVPHIANPAAVDKGDGDGAVDFKFGQYMTLSYNYFEDYHKTSLIGGDDKNQQYHVTWHHNYWKNCDQRIPLARQADIHYYNNLAEGQTGYCMSLRANTYIYSEYNTFVNCKNPVVDESSGGVCKSYQDAFTDCTGTNNAKIITDKTETVTSANKYANFDTAAGSYVAQNKYLLDTTDRGQANIAAWGGVMKAAADMTTVAMTVPGSDEKPPVVDPDDPSDEPETVDTTALTKAIADAEKAVPSNIYVVGNDTKVSDVNKGTKFMTESDKAAYDKALAAAKALLTKEDATQKEVDDAAAALAAAAGKVQTGTKSTGGSGSSIGGGGSSRPSGGSGSTTTTTPSGSTANKTTNSQGDTVITVTAPNGEELAKVTLPATVSATENKFVDVPDGHWAAKAINTMAALGMVKGVSEDTYDMVSPMTRGSIATILYRLSNGAAGKTTTFADVAENAWYADAVGWAAATGVVNGYSDTAFGPDDIIARQQLAVMLARYAKLLGLDTTADVGVLGDFTDGAAVGSWATDDMAWCIQKGILKGRGGSILDPTANVTRAEAAVMLDRMLDLIK